MNQTHPHEKEELVHLILPDIRMDISDRNEESLRMVMDKLHPSNIADILRELETEDITFLLQAIHLEDAIHSLEVLQDHEQGEIIRNLEQPRAAKLLEGMAADERVDIIQRLERNEREELLKQLPDTERKDIETLAQYSGETAGGLMTTNFAYLYRENTVQEGLRKIRNISDQPEELYYLYIVDEEKRLHGIVTMRDLLSAHDETKLEEIAETDLITVDPEEDQEMVAQLLQKYNFVAIPVTDDERNLLGIVTSDDVMEVVEQETSEDFQRLGGSEPLDRPYFDLSILRMSRKRVGWLLLLFVGGTLTSSVIGMFEKQLHQELLLSYFVPLLIGTGGNAGAQAVTTVIRALALDEVRWENIFSVVYREFLTGLLMGTALGIAGFLFVAGFWPGKLRVGLVVAATIPLICVWANIVASIIPIVAERVGIDPTVISAPLITTLVDATGLVMYFVMATLILGP